MITSRSYTPSIYKFHLPVFSNIFNSRKNLDYSKIFKRKHRSSKNKLFSETLGKLAPNLHQCSGVFFQRNVLFSGIQSVVLVVTDLQLIYFLGSVRKEQSFIESNFFCFLNLKIPYSLRY